MKVGSQTKLNVSSTEDLHQKNVCDKSQPQHSPPSGSWRQAIFNRIHITSNNGSNSQKKSEINEKSENATKGDQKLIEMNEMPKKKSTKELRELWRSAIKQQMILNKMDKQNKRLQGMSFQYFKCIQFN